MCANLPVQWPWWIPLPLFAFFETHCDKIDESGWLKRIMNMNGPTTFSRLSIAIGTPQSPPSEDEFRRFAVALNLGTDLTMSEIAKVRRLHFEAVTMSYL